MNIYTCNENNLQEINEQQIKKESQLQRICESNLELLFNLKYVRSEFSISSFRIDTVAFDTSTNSFVIIEYKKVKSISVVDQGYTYLSILLNNKADFILEYNECCDNTLKKKDIDWTQSRVLFISPSFTVYQKESINFRDLPIELWEVKSFDSNIIYFNQITPGKASESIKAISSKEKEYQKVNKEIKVYTVSDHMQNVSEDINDLYSTFSESILGLGNNIEFKATGLYIRFLVNKRNFTDITILKNSLKIWISLKLGNLDDAKRLARDVSSIGHWGNGDYEIKVTNDDDLEYILSLIKQSYKKAFNK